MNTCGISGKMSAQSRQAPAAPRAQVTTAAPDPLWVAKITSVPPGFRSRSLAVVRDRHRRRVVGFVIL